MNNLPVGGGVGRFQRADNYLYGHVGSDSVAAQRGEARNTGHTGKNGAANGDVELRNGRRAADTACSQRVKGVKIAEYPEKQHS